MKSEIVKRKPSDLKPDPNQPRKKFDQDAIKNLSQTMQIQGIINPIEIDENNVIITGELRWRASKIVFKNGEEIECKLIIGLDKIERLERQTIENIHHNALKDDELENVINKLWDSKKYNSKKELGNKIALTEKWVKELIRLPIAKKEVGSKEALKLPISTVVEIDAKVKNKVDKQKIAKKAIEEKLTRDQVRKVIKITKELPKDVKDEVLKPKSKITIKEAKELSKLPTDVRKEVLKKKDPITIKEAKEIAVIPDQKLRKETIQHLKKENIMNKRTKDYIIGVGQKKIKPPVKIIDIDQKIINQFIDLKRSIVIKMSIRHVESYNEPTQNKLIRIMKETLEYLQKELNIKGEIIDV